jgi:hypothetical protein
MRTDGPEQQTLSVVLQGFSCAHSERGWERVSGLGATGSGRVAWRGRRGMLKTLQSVQWFVVKRSCLNFARRSLEPRPMHDHSRIHSRRPAHRTCPIVSVGWQISASGEPPSWAVQPFVVLGSGRAGPRPAVCSPFPSVPETR